MVLITIWGVIFSFSFFPLLDTLNFLGLLTLELNDRLNILILDQTEKIQEVIKVAYIDQYSVDKESQSIYRSTNYIYIYIYIYI
jgi:hypothetical protein